MAIAKRETSSAPPRRPATKRPSARVHVPAAAELPVTRAMLAEVRTELVERIEQAKNELRAEIQGVRAEVHELRAEIHGLKAEMARIALLVEEQNARNKIVLDALMAVIDRQDRGERRMDEVEETVRALAAARAAR